MSLKLEDIKGIGKKAETLREAGIDSVEKLASADIDELIKLKGIGKSSAEKLIEEARNLLQSKEDSTETTEAEEEKKEETEELKEISEEEIKKQEEKRKRLEGKPVEKGDFILVKITGKTQKGKIFRVSSVEDAKKAGIYDEEKAKQGYYSPDFVIVGKPGFLNEGLTETIEKMHYFEKKAVRIPPAKAFGKRDPKKIERIGINKFRRLNDGKNPEIGQEFVKKGTGQRGVVTNIVQGRVIIDYNHPLAGQYIDYIVEIVDKIEDFEEKIKYFMISKGIPEDVVPDFKINYDKETKDIEFTIPKMYLFQNLTYFKFGLAMDLQTHMADEINNVKFVEIFEKMPTPPVIEKPPEEKEESQETVEKQGDAQKETEKEEKNGQ
ncbi:MAG: helix-hairpin-helix domain-containing protein [Promethearchaeota archaeon]